MGVRALGLLSEWGRKVCVLVQCSFNNVSLINAMVLCGSVSRFLSRDSTLKMIDLAQLTTLHRAGSWLT